MEFSPHLFREPQYQIMQSTSSPMLERLTQMSLIQSEFEPLNQDLSWISISSFWRAEVWSKEWNQISINEFIILLLGRMLDWFWQEALSSLNLGWQECYWIWFGPFTLIFNVCTVWSDVSFFLLLKSFVRTTMIRKEFYNDWQKTSVKNGFIFCCISL